jgi:hypothetical protein
LRPALPSQAGGEQVTQVELPTIMNASHLPSSRLALLGGARRSTHAVQRSAQRSARSAIFDSRVARVGPSNERLHSAALSLSRVSLLAIQLSLVLQSRALGMNPTSCQAVSSCHAPDKERVLANQGCVCNQAQVQPCTPPVRAGTNLHYKSVIRRRAGGRLDEDSALCKPMQRLQGGRQTKIWAYVWRGAPLLGHSKAAPALRCHPSLWHRWSKDGSCQVRLVAWLSYANGPAGLLDIIVTGSTPK